MTNSDREFSDLKLERKECPKCGAVWMNGEHRWRTGNPGNELDLAGLVCNQNGDETCINPKKGEIGGQTWEDRLETITAELSKLHKKMTEESEM
jgi:ribosomal protein S27AE